MVGERFGLLDDLKTKEMYPRKPLTEGCPEYWATSMWASGETSRDGVLWVVYQARFVCGKVDFVAEAEIRKDVSTDLVTRSKAYEGLRLRAEDEIMKRLKE